MKNTTNYNLKKPEGTDVVNVEDFNANADIIDNKLKELETSEIFYAVATGSANSYTVSISALNTLSNYYDGLAVCVKINVASTGASTLNINNWGAKSIIDSLGNPINSGGLKAGIPYTLRYNGVNFILQGKGGGGNVTADKLLVGTTATGDTGEVIGTMPNYAGSTISTVGESTVITAVDNFVGTGTAMYGTLSHKLKASGYMNGETIVKQNIQGLNPNVIKAGQPIGNSTLGITGTFTADGTAVAGDMLATKTAYVNGNKITGTIPSKATATINPSTTAQTIASGQYISGTQTIAPVTGTANVAHVLSGYGFSSANGINLTGTIPSKGATTYTPGTANQTIATGQYISGTQTILGDPDLIASNIVSTANIFGVQGTATVESLGGTFIQMYKSATNYQYSIGSTVIDEAGNVYVLATNGLSSGCIIYKFDTRLNLVAQVSVARADTSDSYIRYDRFTNLIYYNIGVANSPGAGWYDTNLNYVGYTYRTNRSLGRYDNTTVHTLDEVTGDIYRVSKNTGATISKIDINGNIVYSTTTASVFASSTNSYLLSIGLTLNKIFLVDTNPSGSKYTVFNKSDGVKVSQTSWGSYYYYGALGNGSTNYVLVPRNYSSSGGSTGGFILREDLTSVYLGVLSSDGWQCAFSPNGRAVISMFNGQYEYATGMIINDGNFPTTVPTIHPFVAQLADQKPWVGASINSNHEIAFVSPTKTVCKIKI